LDIQATGNTGIFAVRFLPNGFAPFTEYAIGNMENIDIPLINLFGEDAIILENEVLKATTNE